MWTQHPRKKKTVCNLCINIVEQVEDENDLQEIEMNNIVTSIPTAIRKQSKQ